MTLACWFNRKTLGSGAQFLLSVNATSLTSFNGIAGLGSGQPSLAAVSNAGSGAGIATASSSYSLNQWNHACGVFESSTSRKILLNGGSSVTNSTSRNVSGQNNISIGTRFAAGAQGAFANALIAEAGIWNVALTDDEIASLAKGMTCNLVRPQSLVFYAPLIRELQDIKGGLTLTNNNTATVVDHTRVYQ